jgi:hypothetical protein
MRPSRIDRVSNMANAMVVTVLGSIPLSSDTVEFEGRQMSHIELLLKSQKILFLTYKTATYSISHQSQLIWNGTTGQRTWHTLQDIPENRGRWK